MKAITPDLKMALAAARTPTADRPDPAALREKCQEFEAIFIESMFKSMRAAIPQGGLLDKGMGTEVFEEMRDSEIARQMARDQGLGIGEALYRQLQKGEEEAGDKES